MGRCGHRVFGLVGVYRVVYGAVRAVDRRQRFRLRSVGPVPVSVSELAADRREHVSEPADFAVTEPTERNGPRPHAPNHDRATRPPQSGGTA